jgi:hypothetical protein
MPGWDYRIVENEDGDLVLAEVYYDTEGKPMLYGPVGDSDFVFDAEEGPDAIRGALAMMLSDSFKPAFKHADFASQELAGIEKSIREGSVGFVPFGEFFASIADATQEEE